MFEVALKNIFRCFNRYAKFRNENFYCLSIVQKQKVFLFSNIH